MARITPNPRYTCFPIVIAPLPPLPKTTAVCFYRLASHLIVVSLGLLEFEFDNLRAFLGRAVISPFLHGFEARLNQERMAPKGPGTLYATVGRNRHFNPDLPGEAHPASDVGQHGIDPGLELALGLLVRLLCRCRRKHECHQRHCGENAPAPCESHLNHTLRRKVPQQEEGKPRASAQSRLESRCDQLGFSLSLLFTYG